MTRENNFDIVRLILASIVVFFHADVLSGSPSLAGITHFLSAAVAVEGFFVISGFLIFASYERSKTLRQFFANRAWRILPGYWLATLLCLAIAFSRGCFHVGYFLLANLTFANFLHPTIPGVLRPPAGGALNGSLWTIKIEIAFYLCVPVFVWLCRKLNRDAVLVLLFVGSLAYKVAMAKHEKLAIQLPGQLCFFVVGAFVYYHLAWFKRNGLWIMAGAAVMFAAHAWTGWFFLRPISLGLLTMGACLLLPHIEGPTRWGDFSYGTYVVHYPIIQLMVTLGLFAVHPWAALGLAVILVAMMATFSWFAVEKPAMMHAKSSRLRRAAAGETANYPAAVP